MIHDEHPFIDPEDQRDPIRRFRGRLSSPVTIVTAGGPEHRTGLTVSSLMVAEGDPAHLHFLLGTANDLWDALLEEERLVVHVLEGRHRELSDRFAGFRPSPGGPFAGLAVEDSSHGPVLLDIETRAWCRFVQASDGDGAYVLVDSVVERVDNGDLQDPLQWFRGGYRRLNGA